MFDRRLPTNLTAAIGQTAQLRCRVFNQGNMTVRGRCLCNLSFSLFSLSLSLCSYTDLNFQDEKIYDHRDKPRCMLIKSIFRSEPFPHSHNIHIYYLVSHTYSFSQSISKFTLFFFRSPGYVRTRCTFCRQGSTRTSATTDS